MWFVAQWIRWVGWIGPERGGWPGLRGGWFPFHGGSYCIVHSSCSKLCIFKVLWLLTRLWDLMIIFSILCTLKRLLGDQKA